MLRPRKARVATSEKSALQFENNKIPKIWFSSLIAISVMEGHGFISKTGMSSSPNTESYHIKPVDWLGPNPSLDVTSVVQFALSLPDICEDSPSICIFCTFLENRISCFHVLQSWCGHFLGVHWGCCAKTWSPSIWPTFWPVSCWPSHPLLWPCPACARLGWHTNHCILQTFCRQTLSNPWDLADKP